MEAATWLAGWGPQVKVQVPQSAVALAAAVLVQPVELVLPAPREVQRLVQREVVQQGPMRQPPQGWQVWKPLRAWLRVQAPL